MSLHLLPGKTKVWMSNPAGTATSKHEVCSCLRKVVAQVVVWERVDVPFTSGEDVNVTSE